MRYHHIKPEFYIHRYGKVYICDHPIYNRCTLYELNGKGLAIIQQRFDISAKTTAWSEIDPWLTDAIYLNPGFCKLFEERAKSDTDGLFPTITVRQIMWALKMKPIPKEPWETAFDRRNI